MTYRRDLGTIGEDLAARFLAERGLEVRERNIRTPVGEIDILARHGDVVVFVEVRLRRGSPGDASGSVGPAKLRRMRRSALAYCKAAGIDPDSTRLDVVAIDFARGRSSPAINHYEGVEMHP